MTAVRILRSLATLAGVLLVAGCASLNAPSNQPASGNTEPISVTSGQRRLMGATASNPASGEPTASPVVVGGLPGSFDGSPVLIGADATRAFAASSDVSPILVGGWLAAPAAMSCPMIRPTDPWPIPCFAIRLASTPTGDRPISLFIGSLGVTFPAVAVGHVRPVVLRVHTHDAACVDVDRCGAVPAIEEIAWTAVPIEIPKPTSTRPPTGITRNEAVTTALAFAATQSGGLRMVRSAIAGPYGLVAPPGVDVDAEHWVWAVVIGGSFGPPDCPRVPSGSPCTPVADSELVVLDYADGTFLMATSPAP